MDFLRRLFGEVKQNNKVTYTPAIFNNFSFSSRMESDKRVPSTVRGTLALKNMEGVEIFDGTTLESGQMKWGTTFIKVPLPEGSDHAELLHNHAIQEINGSAFFCLPVPIDKTVERSNILSADDMKALLEQGEPVVLNVSNAPSMLFTELGRDSRLNAFLGMPDYGVDPQFQTEELRGS